MASNSSFFYWYRRYKVRAVDMNNFQSAMVEQSRGLSEGALDASILKGFDVSAVSGFSLSISAGISTAASGYLGVINSETVLDVSSAVDGTYPTRSLVVCTPELIDSNYINSPTSPFTQVPLNQVQGAEIILIPGAASGTPEYPSKGPNDVILCGLVVPPGASGISSSMIDYEVRDCIGANSLIGQFQAHYDNRLRPYRVSNRVLGIKPSQNIGAGPIGFSYPGRFTPSLYPLAGGAFNPEDTFIDFKTGFISGGDMTSSGFAPVVPNSNNSVVCLVTLTTNDLLRFNFGTEGGYDQCLNAIRNQIYSGPGSLAAQDGNFPLAYVILTAFSGNLSDIQVIDGRPFLGSGSSAAKYVQEEPTGVINGVNTIFVLSQTPSDANSLIFWVDENALEKDTDYTLNGTNVVITNPDFVPAAGQTVYAYYLTNGAVPGSGGSTSTTLYFQEIPTGTVDGSNATFSLSQTPVDPNSLILWTGLDTVPKTAYSLSGATITITDSDYIPQPGQTPYAYYLYLGSGGGGGGGGGGTSGYAVFGSAASPLVVDASVGVTVSSDPRQLRFLESSGGAVTVFANPQIAAGSTIGQELVLCGGSDTNTLRINDGTGTSQNGSVVLTTNSRIYYFWNGTKWDEISRR